MEKIELSVIITYYNDVNNTILKNIELLNDLNIIYEVIIIDDGSYIPLKIENFDNVKIIRTTNHGVSCARNKGIEMSNGKYIIFLDADDFLTKEFICFLNKNFEFFDTDWILFDKIVVNKDKRISLQVFDTEDVTKQCLYKTVITTGLLNECWGKLIKKEYIDQNEIKFDRNVNQGEDYLFNMNLIINDCSIKYCKIYSYIYILRSNSGDNRFLKNPLVGFNSSITVYNKELEIIKKINDKKNKLTAYRYFNSDCVRSAANKLMALYANGYYKTYKIQYWEYVDCMKIKSIKIKYVKKFLSKIYLIIFKYHMTFAFKLLSKLRDKHING